MCGLTGFTHQDLPAPRIIRRTTETLRHRGPDESDIFESRHLSLGAVRLKIIDLASGRQPMATEFGDCVLAFNGEIYNHAELRAELQSLGHKFKSQCDTEVALRAFTQWDVHCFKRFRGMFAAAFWQERTKRLLLVRDRFGIKPLYYALHKGHIFFASELKALFGHAEIPRQLSRQALAYYLSLNYVPGPLTLVEGIEKLPPGTWLEWKDGKIARQTYWQNTMCPLDISLEDASQELDRLLNQSVREHLVSDVPVGFWLSGGLDSAAVLHYAAHHHRRPLRTFSISFEARDCDESRYYRPLAQHYGTQHHELNLHSDLDLTGAIHELSYYSDEPSADAGALPVWFLSKMTASHVRVALTGEGSDEVFGGYQTYLADNYSKLARRLPQSLLRLGAQCANKIPVSDRKIGLDYKLKRFLAGSLLPPDQAHFFWNGSFGEQEQRELGLDCHDGLLASLVARLPNLPTGLDCNRYLFVDQHYYLPDDILYKCDRMSMAHALEVRPPFLDHRLVEFAARLPSKFKIKGFETKVLLRRLMRSKLPKGLINPCKQGLDIPAHDWLRGPLLPLLLETLSRERVEEAGLFSSASIERLIDLHINRQSNLGYHLWGLLTLHLWIRRWNIQTQDLTAGSISGALAVAAG